MSFPASQSLISKLQGQKVRLPNLGAMLTDWPRATNPHRRKSGEVVAEMLNTYSFSPTMTAKLRRADIGHLVSVWFPYATEETLIEVTYFVGWMYLIDDELDGLSNPEGQPGFKSLIDNTIAFFENEENVDNGAFDRIKKEGYEGVESFEKTGIALRKRYTREQRKLFYEEATKTLEMYQVENDIRIAGRLPTLDEYWNYREGSSCIGMVVAMIEFANGLSIPSDVMLHPDMKELRKETNLIHWITNDIVSAKKEIYAGFAENLVALYSGPEGDAQKGIDISVEFLQAAVNRFEVAVTNVISHWCSPDQADRKLAGDVEVFVKGCRCMITGNLTWSFLTARYGLGDAEKCDDGAIIFEL